MKRADVLKLPAWFLVGRAHFGTCPICEGRTIFCKYDEWLRDNYRCVRCWSIPRQRALVWTLQKYFPSLATLSIHESSPCGPASAWIRHHAGQYLATQYFPDALPGHNKNGFRSENLEALTFGPNEFDLTITQDVMEHVLNPAQAFSEIARTLKPGGAHVFTVPIFSGQETTVRARRGKNGIEYLQEAEFHGNPIDPNGSLVVTDWGDDLLQFIHQQSGLKTERISPIYPSMGLEAEFLDVLISYKR